MKVDKTKWNIFPIKDISIILNGYAFKSEKYCSDGIRIIRITNVQDGFIEDNDPKFYSYSTEKELQRFMLHEGDILISLTGNVGRVGILNDSFLPAALNQRVGCIRPTKKACVKFLYYQLRKESFKEDCIRSAKGVAQLNMSTEWLKEYKLFVPSLSEQQSIATELDSIQTMIDGYKAQLADLDALAQSIFLDMFGAPVHNENSFPICTVGDIYEFRYGQGNNIPESKGNYPCYGSNGIVGYHINFNSEDAPIIGHIGAYAGIVNWGKGKHFVTYNGVRCILKRNDINPIYGFFLLRNQNYRNQTRGGAQPFVSYDILEAPKTFIPPLPLQQQFAERVESIERQKELICQQLTDAEQLMAERMQYYFS